LEIKEKPQYSPFSKEPAPECSPITTFGDKLNRGESRFSGEGFNIVVRTAFIKSLFRLIFSSPITTLGDKLYEREKKA
jgi:hypothetical protein